MKWQDKGSAGSSPCGRCHPAKVEQWILHRHRCRPTVTGDDWCVADVETIEPSSLSSHTLSSSSNSGIDDAEYQPPPPPPTRMRRRVIGRRELRYYSSEQRVLSIVDNLVSVSTENDGSGGGCSPGGAVYLDYHYHRQRKKRGSYRVGQRHHRLILNSNRKAVRRENSHHRQRRDRQPEPAGLRRSSAQPCIDYRKESGSLNLNGKLIYDPRSQSQHDRSRHHPNNSISDISNDTKNGADNCCHPTTRGGNLKPVSRQRHPGTAVSGEVALSPEAHQDNNDDDDDYHCRCYSNNQFSATIVHQQCRHCVATANFDPRLTTTTSQVGQRIDDGKSTTSVHNSFLTKHRGVINDNLVASKTTTTTTPYVEELYTAACDYPAIDRFTFSECAFGPSSSITDIHLGHYRSTTTKHSLPPTVDCGRVEISPRTTNYFPLEDEVVEPNTASPSSSSSTTTTSDAFHNQSNHTNTISSHNNHQSGSGGGGGGGGGGGARLCSSTRWQTSTISSEIPSNCRSQHQHSSSIVRNHWPVGTRKTEVELEVNLEPVKCLSTNQQVKCATTSKPPIKHRPSPLLHRPSPPSSNVIHESVASPAVFVVVATSNQASVVSNNTKMQPKGILKTSLMASTTTTMVANKRQSTTTTTTTKHRGIVFADGSPEIIGYRDYANDEEEEEFERSILALKLESSVVEDLSLLDEEDDCEQLSLKKLTEANTLFNSNYANFKTEVNGLGKPKSDSGPIRFQIQDGYKQPLASSNNKLVSSAAKKLFENNSLKKDDGGGGGGGVWAKSTTETANKTNKPSVVANEAKKVKNRTTTTTTAEKADRDKIDCKAPPTANKFLMEKIDLNKIRIPRASIVDKGRHLDQTEQSRSEPTTVICDNSEVKLTEADSVIMVDSVEGAIITIDSKKLPEMEPNNVNELYILPSVELKSTESDNTSNENMDSLSETSSGCCSVNSCSPSSSPIHTETCSSPTPDSLDSTPDSYDLVKSDSDDLTELSHDLIVSNPERKTISLSRSDEVETIETRFESDGKSLKFDTKNNNNNNVETFLEDNLVTCHNESSQVTASQATGVQLQSVKFHSSEFDSAKSILTPVSSATNKTLISISYRTSNQPTETTSSTTASKRNIMLASLAQDLEKHRTESELSRSTSSQSSSSEDSRLRLLQDLQYDGDLIDDGTNHSDSEDSSDADSDPDMLPDMIDHDSNGDYQSDEDSEDNGSESKSSSSSLASGKPKAMKKIFTKAVNTNKKCTRFFKTNLSKTSKFIVSTTNQLRSDTTEMVKKLKNEKKSSNEGNSLFYLDDDGGSKPKSKWSPSKDLDVYAVSDDTDDSKRSEKKKKFTLHSGQEVFSRAKNVFKRKFDHKKRGQFQGIEEEEQSNTENGNSQIYSGNPKLLGLKRLQSVDQNGEQLAKLPIGTKVLPPKPPVPPRIIAKCTEDSSVLVEPPKAPARRRRSKDLLKTTLQDVLESYNRHLRVFPDDGESVDHLVEVSDTLAINSNFRLHRCLLKNCSTKFNLLTSNLNWATCYDCTSVHRYRGENCHLLREKWANLLDVKAFCKLVNEIKSSERRISLIDSLVFQLCTIIVGFQECNQQPARKVADADLCMVAYQMDREEISDVLLLIPFKSVYETNGKGFETTLVVQLLSLLNRIHRLVSNDDEDEDQPKYQILDPSGLSQFNSLNQLRISCALDVFRIDKQSEISVSNWFASHQSTDYLNKYFINSDGSKCCFKAGSIFDYLEVEFAATASVEAVLESLGETTDLS